jgi:D-lactate dehydrogenase
MRVTVFSTKRYDTAFLDEARSGPIELRYTEARLTHDTAELARGSDAICAFVNDDLGAEVLDHLATLGVKLVALRCAGFNNVDLAAAGRLGIPVCRVPAYSPHSVAEHTMAMVMTLNRKTHRAHARVREGNFALEGLLGFDMAGKTFGIVGTGKIGEALARIAAGFGCEVLGHDVYENPACVALGMRYVARDEILGRSDVLSLNCPLTPATRHLISHASLGQLKHGMMLINTSRGAVVDTLAAIEGLKSGVIGSLGLDVYEEESDMFFEDMSDEVMQDDVFARLLTFPNVLVTGHQAFFTREALTAIAETTMRNLVAFAETGEAIDTVAPQRS